MFSAKVDTGSTRSSSRSRSSEPRIVRAPQRSGSSAATTLPEDPEREQEQDREGDLLGARQVVLDLVVDLHGRERGPARRRPRHRLEPRCDALRRRGASALRDPGARVRRRRSPRSRRARRASATSDGKTGSARTIRTTRARRSCVGSRTRTSSCGAAERPDGALDRRLGPQALAALGDEVVRGAAEEPGRLASRTRPRRRRGRRRPRARCAAGARRGRRSVRPGAILLAGRYDVTAGARADRQVAVGGAVLQDAGRRDRGRPRRARPGERARVKPARDVVVGDRLEITKAQERWTSWSPASPTAAVLRASLRRCTRRHRSRRPSARSAATSGASQSRSARISASGRRSATADGSTRCVADRSAASAPRIPTVPRLSPPPRRRR